MQECLSVATQSLPNSPSSNPPSCKMSEGGVLIPYDHSSPYNSGRYPVLLGGTDPGQRESRHHTGEYFRANEIYSSTSKVSFKEDERDTKSWPTKLVQSLGIELPIERQHQALPEYLTFTRNPPFYEYSCDAHERTVHGEITRINGYVKDGTAPSSLPRNQVQRFQVNQTLTLKPGPLIPSDLPSEICITRDSVSRFIRCGITCTADVSYHRGRHCCTTHRCPVSQSRPRLNRPSIKLVVYVLTIQTLKGFSTPRHLTWSHTMS
jgi:hypothetical protein